MATRYQFVDDSGETRLAGFLVPEPGGSGTPGALLVADYIFNEPAGANADLTAAFTVPTGATVVDVVAYALAAPWDAAAKLKVGDGAQANGYFNALDLKTGLSTTYNPTTNGQGSQWDDPGNNFVGAYKAVCGLFTGGSTPGVFYPAGGTVTMTVSAIASGGGGGQLLVRILYATAITAVVAT